MVVQVLVAALLLGCTSPGLLTKPAPSFAANRRWSDEAEKIGVTEHEIAEVVRIATARYKLVVIWVQKADCGGIAVYLADKPNRPHGIVVVFRKVDGHWQEDSKSKDEWIV